MKSNPFHTIALLTLSGCLTISLSVACGDLESSDESGGTPQSANTGSYGGDPYTGNTSGGQTGSYATAGGATGSTGTTGGNVNVNFSGEQDFGFFRRLIAEGQIPTSDQFDASGFFAEHHNPLPTPDCGERICAQAMVGVMGNLMNGETCTLLQVGLNSPIVPNPDNRPPLNLVVIVDTSGSMEDRGKMEFVREGLQKLLLELDDQDSFTLVTYSDAAQIVLPATPIDGNENDIRDAILTLYARGSTNLYSGLQTGYREALSNYDSGKQNRVILLSDGQPTAGDTNPENILAMSRNFNSDGIGITTIGLGTSFNYTLMRDLALQGDGNYYFVEDSAAVDEVFSDEVSYFTVPVAFDLELKVKTGSDYTFGRALGTPMWNDTQDGGKLSIPSVFLAHRTAHDDVTPDNGRRGGGSALLIELMPRQDDGSAPNTADVSTVELSFREPGTNTIIQQTVEVTYPYAPWETLFQGFFENATVTKSFVMLNIFVALQEACDLYHNNQPEEAINLLRRLVAAASDYEDSANDGEGDVDIQLDIELMEDVIDLLIQLSSDPPAEEMPEDPWPAD